MRSLGFKKKWPAGVGLLIILSVFLWFRLSIKEVPLSILIHYINIPEGMTIVAPSTKVFEVVVRGSKSRIKKISKTGPLQYELDLSNAVVGTNALPVQLENLVLPSGISVLRSNLSLLTVRMDRQVQKALPIQVVLAGKPGPGFVIADSVVEPSQVLLTGPETLLGPMVDVKTKPIEISGEKDSFRKNARLDLSEDIHPALPENGFVAHVFIEEKIIIKSFEQVVIKGKNTAYGYAVTPPALDLKVRGPQSLVDKLSDGKGLEVFIDLEDIMPGVYVRFATIRMPVGAIPVSVKPEIFTVTVSR